MKGLECLIFPNVTRWFLVTFSFVPFVSCGLFLYLDVSGLGSEETGRTVL